MQNTRRVVAVAGAGSLGRYACEELLAAPDFELVIISRDVRFCISLSVYLSVSLSRKKERTLHSRRM